MACADICPVSAIRFKRPFAGARRLGKTAKKLWAPLALAALVCLTLAVNIYPAAENIEPYSVGSPCPAFSLALEGGGELSRDDCAGKVTVINFWATWCSPCVKELPEFERLYRKYAPEIAFYAADAFTETGDAAAFCREHAYTIPLAYDDGSAIKAFGDWDALPVTVILDIDGTIVYNAPGAFNKGELEKLLEEYLRK